jgi:hypothetical protein
MRRRRIFTIGAPGQHFGVPAWKVRRVFERGLLPPAARCGTYRVVTDDELPQVEAALKAAGYLPDQAREVAEEAVQ